MLLITMLLQVPDYLLNTRSFLAIRTEKTTQGISDKREKTSPIVPAVEGIIIKTPDASPHIEVVLLKMSDLNMT